MCGVWFCRIVCEAWCQVGSLGDEIARAHTFSVPPCYPYSVDPSRCSCKDEHVQWNHSVSFGIQFHGSLDMFFFQKTQKVINDFKNCTVYFVHICVCEVWFLVGIQYHGCLGIYMFEDP